MSSKTQKTEHKRKRKEHNKGKARKRILRREGSTRTAAELFGDK